ncbi:Trm112p-domain-containing protein [Aureobasidium subglaciale]|nr:Trm112p-domain-containing protein [Aureobasidium subglaciale]
MKLLTLNFLTCARKACKQEPAAFPLHPRDAELESVEIEMNPEFLINVLPRLEWKAVRSLGEELGLPTLPEQAPEADDLREKDTQEPTQTLKDLHALLVETSVANGKLVCGHCGHEYAVKEGIANFLLPSHLV